VGKQPYQSVLSKQNYLNLYVYHLKQKFSLQVLIGRWGGGLDLGVNSYPFVGLFFLNPYFNNKKQQGKELVELFLQIIYNVDKQ
jgi:hypothetical protein